MLCTHDLSLDADSGISDDKEAKKAVLTVGNRQEDFNHPPILKASKYLVHVWFLVLFYPLAIKVIDNGHQLFPFYCLTQSRDIVLSNDRNKY